MGLWHWCLSVSAKVAVFLRLIPLLPSVTIPQSLYCEYQKRSELAAQLTTAGSAMMHYGYGKQAWVRSCLCLSIPKISHIQDVLSWLHVQPKLQRTRALTLGSTKRSWSANCPRSYII